MATLPDKNKGRLLLVVFLLSLPVLAQEIIFTDGFENHPPIITSSPILIGEVGDAYSYNVDAMDIDGDALRYLLKTAPGGMHINVISGEISWTPDKEGSFAVTVEASDPEDATGMQSWSINVAAGQDSDVDGLADHVEGLLGTDPNDPDSDDDGLKDGAEVNTRGTDPLNPDSDSDGLNDGSEVDTYSTNPTKIDTDGDNFGDGLELDAGTDPLNPEDFPSGPPDPQAIATSNDPTITTTLYGSSAFIYENEPPIQTGVAEGTIDPLRVAVLRGLITSRDGSPLPAVKITIQKHPEYGQTLSRVDGKFDLVVNGGSPLVLNYEKIGFLPAQRLVEVPWQEYSIVPDAALIPLDSQVTAIDLSVGDMQVAQSSLVTDDDGERQATILFSQGNTAELVMSDGSVQAISSLNVRATEFTVGENGPTAMPGELPYNSGYNYAVELSVDEAIAAGAADVRFSEPVQLYVDNFVGIPVGTDVPTGYYDRELAAWVPIDDGRVIKILSVNGGLAELDTDGTGITSDEAALTLLGISDAERQRLATLYQPNDELWRVPITHFTPYDCNYPFGPPLDARTPDVPGPKTGAPKKPPVTCKTKGNSIIECQTQVYSEVLPIIGTPYSFVYRSDRVPGRVSNESVQIPLSGDTVPESLKRIELQVGVQGQQSQSIFPPDVNLDTVYSWDSKDVYGRQVQGFKRLTGSIGYVYDQVNLSPGDFERSFARFGDSELAVGPGRVEVKLKQPFATTVGSWDARGQGLGGWTLDVHHAYDPVSRTLLSGDNSASSASNINSTLKNIVDIQPLLRPNNQSLAVGPDGTVFFNVNASERGGGIWRVEADRSATLLGRSHGFSCNTSPDGTPFRDVRICGAISLEMGPDGLLYWVDGAKILRINPYDPESLLETVAGSGIQGFAGDGGPAIEASMGFFISFAISKDGSLYIADSDNHRIRQVTPDGVIGTIAGSGDNSVGGDGFAARLAEVANPFGIAVDDLGNIYFSDGIRGSGSGTGACQIRRIGPDGIIEHFAGTGQCGDGLDGISADETMLGHMPHDITVAEDGIIITDVSFDIRNSSYLGRIRKINSDGIVETIVGGGQMLSEDGTPPLSAAFGYIGDFVQGKDGTNYLFDTLPRSVSPVLPGLSLSDVGIAAEGGDLFYVFNNKGRHLRSLNALTGSTLLEFGYTVGGLLTGITDADGNITVIERDSGDMPSAIVSPFGQRTELTVDANGFISSLVNPASEMTQIVSTAGGLITSFKNPRGNTSTYSYDPLGRLNRVENIVGGFQTFERAELENGYEVTRTTAEGIIKTYRVENLPNGTTFQQNSFAGILQFELLEEPDGSRQITHSDGTVVNSVLGPDPRFQSAAPKFSSIIMATPGGVESNLGYSSSVSLDDENDPFSLVGSTDAVTVDGRTHSSDYDAATKTFSTISPAGIMEVVDYDSQGKPTGVQIADLVPARYLYDNKGRLTSFILGDGDEARSTNFTYNAQGWVESLIDPLGRDTVFSYDAAGRLLSETLPDGRTTHFTHDANSSLASVVPPTGKAHLFSYTNVDLIESYAPPALGGVTKTTDYTYNLDGSVSSISRADGSTMDFSYNNTGDLSTLETPTGDYTFSFNTAGFVDSITAPGNVDLLFIYDGFLPVSESLTGAVNGSVSRSYDQDSTRVNSLSVNGSLNTSYSYDDDNRVTSAGTLQIGRDSINGLVSDITLGNHQEIWQHNSFAEIEEYSASNGVIDLYSSQLTRNKLGQITRKIEAVEGVTTTFDYSYDLADQLVGVRENDVQVGTYLYDINSNRIYLTDDSGVSTASYDSQDRLVTYGDTSYTYTDNGDLLTQSTAGEVTTYSYDALGNLIEVTLPDGKQLTYLVDGKNRRVGKKIDGVLVQGLLYKDSLNPVAELDVDGNVVSHFVYATKDNIPDYMERDGKTYRMVSDYLGSLRLVVDVSDGAIAQRVNYDAFGKVVVDTNPGFQPFGFAGGLYDPDTGLTRFGARDYDAHSGRWTARDPILFAGLSVNLYAYAHNDPINLADHNGKLAPLIIWALAAGWTALEISFSVADVLSTVDILMDPCQSVTAKVLVTGATAAGFILPGAGFGAAYKVGSEVTSSMKHLNQLDNMVDTYKAGKKVRKTPKMDEAFRKLGVDPDDIEVVKPFQKSGGRHKQDGIDNYGFGFD